MMRALLLGLGVALAFTPAADGVSIGPLPANAQLLDDAANMKILRARAELARGSATRMYSGGQLKSKQELENEIRGRATCGAVDIGNQTVDTGFTGQVTVVIAGDIVNSGNNCR